MGANRRGQGEKLNHTKVREIRAMIAQGVPGVIIYRRFGISKQTFCDIKNGRTWRSVT